MPPSTASTASALRRGLARVPVPAVPRRDLRSVPRRRPRRPRVPFVTLVSVVLVAGVVGLLLFNTSMQQASFDSSRLEAQAAALSAREEGLRMELEALRDPQRLAVQARRNGMVPARTAAFLDLGTGEVSGPEPTPATRADGLNPDPPPRRKPRVLTPPPVAVEDAPAAVIGDAAVQGPPAGSTRDGGRSGAPRGNGGPDADSGGTGR